MNFLLPPSETNPLFVLDGHQGRKLLKPSSNTALAIRVSTKRVLALCWHLEREEEEEKGGRMELVLGGLDVYRSLF